MNTTSNTNNPCIVCPIYYKPELYLTIDKCLKSIKRHYPDWTLITLDDCSPTYSPFPTTIQNGTNMGYTYSVNRLLEEGFKTSDIVIILNDDVELRSGDLSKFKTIKDGIYSPPDTASGSLETFGCCWGLNKATFEKMGKLDERFVNYFSDMEYFERAKKLGVPVVKWSEPRIIHHESSTFNLVDKDELFERDFATYRQMHS